MAFIFKLETLLRHRRMIEDERQRELAKCMRHRMILLDQLRQMQTTIQTSRHDLAGSLVGKVDLEQVGRFAHYSLQVRQRAQGIVQQTALIERQINAARERLIEATRARKALELLRDKQERAWRQQQERRDAAAMDEMAVQAYARRMAVGEVG